MKGQKILKEAVLTALLGIFMFGCVSEVSAVGHPYDRRSSVAESEMLFQSGNPGIRTISGVNKNAWIKKNGKCYNGSGKVIEGAFLRGIDVSEWQKTINWKKVAKSDVDFAIIRISYGTGYLDQTYDYNMKEATKAGIPVGTYVYSLATTREMALEEAQLAIKKMKGYKISYPVVYDMEYYKMGNLSSREAAELAYVFCSEIKKAGYFPMIYCNVNWYLNEIDWSIIDSYDVWLAQFGDKINAPSHEDFNYTIWQATDGAEENGLNPTRGLIDGIPENCDVDIDFGFKDYTKVITPRTQPLASYVPTDKESLKNGWITVNGKTYYYVNGKKVTGWKSIDGKAYRFDYSSGVMYTNRLLTNSTHVVHYVGSDGVRYENKWLTYKGKTYYFDNKGKALKGWNTIDGDDYCFDEITGAMYTKKLFNEKHVIRYVGSNGKAYKKKWLTYNGKKYYFGKDGKAVKGWTTIGGIQYRFNGLTGVMYTNRMFVDDGEISYAGADGKRYMGKWLTYEGRRYRINVKGVACKGGWIMVCSKYYYFDDEEGYLYKNQRIVKNGNIYFAGSNGVRCSDGFYTDKKTGYTYYFDKTGKAYRGWHTINGKKYYFYKGTSAKSGARAENVTLVSGSGVVSVFDKNGVCTKQYKEK